MDVFRIKKKTFKQEPRGLVYKAEMQGVNELCRVHKKII
jgi:hypothetical protein